MLTGNQQSDSQNARFANHTERQMVTLKYLRYLSWFPLYSV